MRSITRTIRGSITPLRSSCSSQRQRSIYRQPNSCTRLVSSHAFGIRTPQDAAENEEKNRKQAARWVALNEKYRPEVEARRAGARVAVPA